MLIRLGLILAITLAGSGLVEAASFPCDKAETADEKAICATPALNDRDVELAVRFEILKEVLAMGNRAQLQDDQETWLKERRACGADIACLQQTYETRLKVLRGVLSEFAKQGPQ
ncbi:lysozyme inhibitor LprI family protein [Methylobacterium sp. C25]|uniref:lysozyme inhibitor LprI family protein n=1 Tax=Methylobacterium sp. C25 TaxID=2721622 RepID=UPI001F25B77F|nr:lysozyme inhibitor LprI family protein [Methylobacterium sp. C25]